jgi:hypothetical protein
MRFTLNGRSYNLTADDVRRRLRDIQPEPVRRLGVRVDATVYPVRQAFEAATGIQRAEFNPHTARRHLAALGFEVVGEPTSRDETPPATGPAEDDWHTEARIVEILVRHLTATGWYVQSVADTASRQAGVDIMANRPGQTVAIEVKGYPSRHYADPARAGQVKPTQPATQARHWYAHALLAAMLTRSAQPTARSVIALPDFGTYQALYTRTAGSLRAATIEVWWVRQDGTVTPAD